MKRTRPPEPTWHSLRVRTPADELWEPACQFMLSLELALKAGHMLRDFLAGEPEAQRDAPPWAVAIRASVAEDGTDTTACTVEVWRGGPGRWQPLAALPARGGARNLLIEGGHRKRRRRAA